MDENPYKSPESGQEGKRSIRFADWVAIAAGILLVASLGVKLFTHSSLAIHGPAAIVHDTAGLVMVSWTLWHFGPRLAARFRTRG
jgi:hypothetical protein